jgi:sporulation protein YlmC with PRC-barrel domain
MSEDRQLIDLGFMLMDRQLIDSKGRRCGKVDDLDLEGGPGEEATVVAVVSGPDAWRAGKHGPIGWITARLFGGSDETALVHLDTIDEIGPVIKLKLPAAELGLGHGDEHTAEFIRRIPGA